MSFIGVEVEQEMSAPPPKQNPGSAPERDSGFLELYFRFQSPVFHIPQTKLSRNDCVICQVHFQFFSKQRRTLGARGFFLAAECFGSSAKVTSGELTWPKPEAAHEKSLTKAICAINCKIQLLSWSHSLRQCGCNRVLSYFSAFGDASHALSRDQPL